MFALVNLALIRIKARERCRAPPAAYIAPAWMPWAGLATCVVLLIVDIVLMV